MKTHTRKKSLMIALLVLAAAAFLQVPALADEMTDQQSEDYGVDGVESAVPDEAREILGDMDVSSADADSGFQKILSYAKGKISEILTGALRSAVVMITVVMLCALAGTVYPDGLPDFIPLCGTMAIAVAVMGDVGSLINMGRETLDTLSTYSKVLLPSLATAAAASGAVTAASAKYSATALFMDVLITIANSVIMPAIYAYLAVITANSALRGNALASAAKLVKWVCTTMMTVLTLAFTAYLSITGAISGSADAAATRLAKTALSSALPVVGSIVSDAASTVVAGASILRNSIGVFGMLAILCVCLIPFLTLGVRFLIYKAAAAVAGTLGDDRFGGLISGFGDAFGMVMALVGAGGLMMFFSIISSIKAVSGG